MGLTRLPRYVGRNRALDILLLGQDFDAKTAYDFGLVTRVVAKADLGERGEACRRADRQRFADRHPRDTRAIAFNSGKAGKTWSLSNRDFARRSSHIPMPMRDPRHSPKNANRNSEPF